jgi:hypothetical protein
MVRDALVRHFGLDAAGLSALDPGPADLPMISIADGEAPDEEIIRAAVSSAYDIAFDDGLLRDASARPSAERPAAFARLRSGYRVRREFSARTVGLPARRASKVVFRP